MRFFQIKVFVDDYARFRSVRRCSRTLQIASWKSITKIPIRTFAKFSEKLVVGILVIDFQANILMISDRFQNLLNKFRFNLRCYWTLYDPPFQNYDIKDSSMKDYFNNCWPLYFHKTKKNIEREVIICSSRLFYSLAFFPKTFLSRRANKNKKYTMVTCQINNDLIRRIEVRITQ